MSNRGEKNKVRWFVRFGDADACISRDGMLHIAGTGNDPEDEPDLVFLSKADWDEFVDGINELWETK